MEFNHIYSGKIWDILQVEDFLYFTSVFQGKLQKIMRHEKDEPNPIIVGILPSPFVYACTGQVQT